MGTSTFGTPATRWARTWRVDRGAYFDRVLHIWDAQSLVKSFEVCELPVRTAKFIARKQWIVTGSDDMLIRVYNYNTMDKVKVFEAHTDYIRSVSRTSCSPMQPCG